MLAGGQSLVPMLNLRLARFEHLVDIGRIGELRGVERRNGSRGRRCRRPATAVIEFDPTVAADVPLLAAVTPVHRPLPDPQPGHDRRLAGPRRPGRRVPGRRRRARRHVRARRRRPASRSVPASEFFTGVWSTALEDDELLRRSPSRCGAGGAGSASPSSPGATATSPSPARSPPSSSTTDDAVARCAVAVFGAAGTPVRATAAEAAVAGRRRRRRRRRRASAATAIDAIDDVADDPQVPAAYRRRIGAAMVADAWRRAIGRRPWTEGPR